MPSVRCPGCSSALAVTASHVPQRFRCSKCESPFEVPATLPAPLHVPASPAPAAPTDRFACPTCKREMQARPENRGKLTKCGNCQAVFPIPAPVSPPPLPPKLELSAEVPPARPRLPRLWLAAGVASVAFLAGGAWMLRSPLATPPPPDPQRGEETVKGTVGTKDAPPVDPKGDPVPTPAPKPVSDLAFVPTKGRALLSIRIADVWKSPPIQKAWGMMPHEVRAQSEEVNRRFGFAIEDFERVTVFIKDDVKEEFWAVLKTAVPLDGARREKILSGANGLDWKKRAYRGLEYQIVSVVAGGADAPKPLGVFIASDQVFVVAPEAVLPLALDHYLDGEKAPGNLDRGPPLIREGRTHVVVCSGISPQDRKALPQAPALMGLAFAGGGPGDVTDVLVTARLADELEVQGTLTLSDEAKAAAYRANFEHLKSLGKPLVQFGGGDGNKMTELVKAFGNVGTAVRGKDVVLSAKLDLARLAPALPGMVAVKGLDQWEKASGAENLKTIAAAFEAYRKENRRYPQAVYRSPTGEPLYSWRVAILPHLGQQALYARFDRTRAWDQGKNKDLIALMPKAFAHPFTPPGKFVGQTSYQLLTGPRSAFANGAGPSTEDLKGKASKLLMLTVSRGMVPWTAPVDLEVPDDAGRVEKEVMPRLGVLAGAEVPAVRFDQSVRKLSPKITGRELLEGIDPSSP